MAKAVFIPIRAKDWAYAQIQYETTDRPIKDIGIEIGVTDMAVIDRASRYRWTRGKDKEGINQAAQLILAERDEKKQRLEVIERVNVEMQAKVLSEHRKDISRARSITNTLFTELKTALVTSEDDEEDGIPLHAKAKILKSLTESLKNLVLLERQAFGISGAIEDPTDGKLTETTPADHALASALNKFASVLGRVKSEVDRPPTIIVDVNGPPN